MTVSASYLYGNDANSNHHLSSGGHKGWLRSRSTPPVEDPVNTVGLYQEGCVGQGEGQVEAGGKDNAGGEAGFKDEGHDDHAGNHITCQHHDGQLLATGFDQTIMSWSGRNQTMTLSFI